MVLLYYQIAIEGDIAMARIKVSPKYQIVIPKEIRESMRLKPGEEVEVMELDGIIEIVRVKPLHELRGTLKGIDIGRIRDDDRL